MASLGSTLYKLTWKERVTPLGRLICALRASAPRTSVNGSIGWATPAAQEAGGTPERFLERKTALDGACGVSLTSLSLQAQLAGWPTPMAGTPARNGNNEAGNTDSSRKTVGLVGWPSPKASNTTGAGTRGDGGDNLQTIATWATPTTRDHKDGASDGTAPINGLLGRQAWLAAGMGSGGQLNPEHSRWLMGYPPAWGSCGAMAMRSFRK